MAPRWQELIFAGQQLGFGGPQDPRRRMGYSPSGSLADYETQAMNPFPVEAGAYQPVPVQPEEVPGLMPTASDPPPVILPAQNPIDEYMNPAQVPPGRQSVDEEGNLYVDGRPVQQQQPSRFQAASYLGSLLSPGSAGGVAIGAQAAEGFDIGAGAIRRTRGGPTSKAQRILEAAPQPTSRQWTPGKGMSEYERVDVDVGKVDKAWAKDPDMYVGPQGEGGIKTRYPDFGRWLQENPDTPIEMPLMGIDSLNRLTFGNGRHRFAWLRDQGETTLPAMVNREQAEAFRSLYGLEPPAGIGHNNPPAGPLPMAAKGVERGKWGKAYGETYPEMGHPTWTQDKTDKSKWYWAKTNTPRVEEFMKDRGKVAKAMEKEGYTPYFDPAKRADVDPANYPSLTETVTATLPKTAKAQAEHAAKAQNPAAMARLEEAYRKGEEVGGGENWYFMKQLEDKFVEELGPEAGRQAFKDKFAGSMAATTGGADPESNFLAAMYGNWQHRQNTLPDAVVAKAPDVPDPAGPRTWESLPAGPREYPQAGWQLPSPVGGRYMTGNLAQHEKYMMGEREFDPLANPKRYNFQYNFLGHPQKATMDEQMTNILIPKTNQPPNYGSAEQAVHNLAAQVGKDPRYVQEVGWAGGKKMKTPGYEPAPMISTVNDAIERTSRLTGMTPDEVVRRGIVRSEIPIYGTANPMAMNPDEDERTRLIRQMAYDRYRSGK